MSDCIVTIPIYKEHLNPSEEASFRQCLKVLKLHEITIFTFKGLDISRYNEIAHELSTKFNVEYFNQKYFESVKGYNMLCLSHEFYDRFKQFEYLLIYQLDAWVFRDELKYWCDKNYDYIGAPIFWAFNSNRFTTKISGIGNGGFSLRKISYCMKVLDEPRNRPYLKPIRIFQMYYNFMKYNDKFKPFHKKILIIPLIFLKIFGVYNTLNYYMRTNQINEDMIFGTNANYSWGRKASLPSNLDAMKFSFEVNPEWSYQIIGNKLPFGCHAFEKWSFQNFWSEYIKF